MHIPLQDVLDLDRREWRQKLLSVVQEATEFHLNRVPYRGGIEPRVMDVRCAPLRDSSGAAIAGILMVQDVTEDVELEEKLSSAERLALVGKIAAKVAHELNNPLDGILRFLGLATRLMDEDKEKARSYLEESRRGLLRMSHILTQLLAFSRSYRGTGNPVGLSQVIRDSLALHEKRAQATNVEMRVDIPLDLPVCPDTELCQVFSNVVKNALDAMGQDGVLTLRAVSENGRVIVTVSDTGPGVPEGIRDKILEPFFTTKKDGTGTGLGLAACVDSLNRIGGSIELKPSEQGATFEIVVPVGTAEES
jgi:C4-dicarboxylate-specific signal transduction histidine kinase